MWDLWWALGQVFSEYFGFPCQSSFNQILQITRDWYNRPVSGRRAEWTQCHPTPRNGKKQPLTKLIFLGEQRMTRVSHSLKSVFVKLVDITFTNVQD
jgi:hypothetical protein